MVARAVSARRDWLTPLAVLVPILATLASAAWAFTLFPPLDLLVIPCGLAVTAFAGSGTLGARTSLVAGACTLLAGLAAVLLWYGVSIDTSICGKEVDQAWRSFAYALGALVFFALGSFGLRTDRATSIVPLALLAGVVAMLTVLVAAPGTPGVCET
jgi:hypothetical protein